MKKLDLNFEKYEALLFDLDGTLIDSMPLHSRAWLETFEEYGADVSPEFLLSMTGMASARIVGLVNEHYNLNLDPKIITTEKRARYVEHLNQVKIFEPVAEIMREYYKKIPLAIITGGSHEVVDQLLPKLGIDKYFDAIICADDTVDGKDSLAPYELAGTMLKVDPKECLFFDDGDVGLKGAQLTGMDVVHVDINHPDIFTIL